MTPADEDLLLFEDEPDRPRALGRHTPRAMVSWAGRSGREEYLAAISAWTPYVYVRDPAALEEEIRELLEDHDHDDGR